MSKWDNLTPAQLSEWAANTPVRVADPSFVAHLRHNGTIADFHQYIDRVDNPLSDCVKLHKDFPQAVEDWLRTKLLQNPNTSPIHRALVEAVVDEFLPSSFLSWVRYPEMSWRDKRIVVHRLAAHRFYDELAAHWDEFVEVFTNPENPAAQDDLLAVVSHGFNADQRLNWKPITEKESELYFYVCCVGGFVDRLPHINIQNNDTLILRSFIWTAVHKPPRAAQVLEYLYDNYPLTPWHSEYVLDKIAALSLPLAERHIAHLQQCNPNMLRQEVVDLACESIEENTPHLLNLALARVHPDDLRDVVFSSLRANQKDCLETIIATRYEDIDLPSLLEWLPPPYAPDVQEVFNKLQSQRLRAHLQGPIAESAKRKM